MFDHSQNKLIWNDVTPYQGANGWLRIVRSLIWGVRFAVGIDLRINHDALSTPTPYSTLIGAQSAVSNSLLFLEEPSFLVNRQQGSLV